MRGTRSASSCLTTTAFSEPGDNATSPSGTASTVTPSSSCSDYLSSGGDITDEFICAKRGKSKNRNVGPGECEVKYNVEYLR